MSTEPGQLHNSNAGIWTTPDAFAGEVHDPKSQKSYMWNDDDPISYADPIGYDATNTQSELTPSEDSGDLDVDTLPLPGEPGSKCAGTDSSGACYQDGQAIEPPSGTKMSGYGSLDDAAKAAAKAYSFIKTAGEVGCAVFCVGTDCGFGAASVTRENSDSTASLIIADVSGLANATRGGIWHTHPSGASAADMEMHNTTAAWGLSHFHLPTFSVYTSQAGKAMQIQVYDLSTENQFVPPSDVP